MFFKKRKKQEHIDIDKELVGINDFLKQAPSDVKKLVKVISDFNKVKKGHSIESKVKRWEKVMQAMEFFQEDTDITGERVKKVADALRKEAKKGKVSKEVKDILKKDIKWNFDW